MRQTSYDLSEQVMGTEGSTRAIAKELGISPAYACYLKQARESCCKVVINHWEDKDLPFELVRQLMRVSKPEQLKHLEKYLGESQNKSKIERGEARKALLAALQEARKPYLP